MLYDLNIPWSSSTPDPSLHRTISFLTSLGYGTLALNYIHSGALPSTISCAIPLPLPFAVPPNTTILRRCTLVFTDPSQNYRMPALAAAYDILALRPTNEKAFLACCTSLTEHSLISLDLTQRFPFHWKPKPLMTAIHRGLRIEICYGQATGGDASARRNFISNVLAIVRATKGRGLVISSEARSVLGVRAPADVLNLLGVWGLGRERGLESVGVRAREVIVNERLKRGSFRGVVDVVYGGEKAAREEHGILPDKSVKKSKREAVESPADGTPVLSKRAQKRARLAAQALPFASAGSEMSTAPALPDDTAVSTTTASSNTKSKDDS
ncbi:hypothetical protein PZA11_004597 [Diplocarpon coronariae]|uniref:Uncharacterized protein n=1 Tax=Diplocarpon coronariae TaxID=2795749 RepID=A0A218YWT4_9HELO|nr:RNase P subunit p30 [Diplocarpon mali]OWP00267.1 hypothetical protein B2J93_3793 [Marssonina coronariae]